ncbi:helix-turn-helix domain-containing protein [Croceimicrobium sp.]|uniref:helix-turn-helix domain-containing protein n=1 Tax=Croceimicrobium sp. TaxID=2828340 RepID=UPI003BA8EDC7
MAKRPAVKYQNRFLALFFLSLSAQALILILRKQIQLPAFWWDNFCFFGFLFGPLLYLFVKNSLERDRGFQGQDLLHFIPAVLIFVSPLLHWSFCRDWGILLYVSLASYNLLSFWALRSYHRIVLETRSLAQGANVAWLLWPILLFTLVVLIDFLDILFINVNLTMGISLTAISILILVNYFFLKALWAPELFRGTDAMERHMHAEIQKVETDLEMAPNETEEQDLQRIKDWISRQEPFLEPDLTLAQLADQLAMSPRYLSGLINQYEQKNFMSFINEYRIQKAKTLLSENEDPGFTIAEAMFGSGFNSKSSFNTLFKKLVGQTPSEYRKSLVSEEGKAK